MKSNSGQLIIITQEFKTKQAEMNVTSGEILSIFISEDNLSKTQVIVVFVYVCV